MAPTAYPGETRYNKANGCAADAVIQRPAGDPGMNARPLKPGDRLALSLEADGLRLVPLGQRHTVSAQSLIGCTGYAGAPLRSEQMDPALYAKP